MKITRKDMMDVLIYVSIYTILFIVILNLKFDFLNIPAETGFAIKFMLQIFVLIIMCHIVIFN